ncbi:hypothetical protein PG2006B_0351 [Bifidobacterium animalis subsp. animalis]|nr:hypothetical protein PG2006B_0351 [Bifidobacterium animalis subsp. animalis]
MQTRGMQACRSGLPVDIWIIPAVGDRQAKYPSAPRRASGSSSMAFSTSWAL